MRRLPLPLRLTVCWLGIVLLTACQPTVTGAANPQARPGQHGAQVSAACQGAADDPGLRSVPVRSQGSSYQVPTYFPRSYTNLRRVPLILDLHGSSSNGRRQMRFSDLNLLAAREGFLVAAPNGAVRTSGRGDRERASWNVPGVPLFGGDPVPDGTRDDVSFLRDVIDQITAKHCVDPQRVYVVGFSGGARMASALACVDGAQVSGIIAVSGLRAGAADASGEEPRRNGCRPAKPVTVIAFHGTADKNAPYYGGSDKEWNYSVPAALREWALVNGCAPTAQRSRVGRTGRLIEYPDCARRDGNRTTVQLWSIQGAGHRWPGNDNRTAYTSGRSTHQVSVAAVVADLLRERSA